MRTAGASLSLSPDLERNLGPQPIALLMAEHSLKPQDLVKASTEQITHKMVARACKGRWLTARVRLKICNALNSATGRSYKVAELFNYSEAGSGGVGE